MPAPSPDKTIPYYGPERDRAVAAQIDALVRTASGIAITGHERPDGDCIGSEVGLCSILRGLGKSCEIVNADPTPDRYRKLAEGFVYPYTDGPVLLSSGAVPDLIFVLDSTDLSRIGRVAAGFGAAVVIDIDHHPGNPLFGTANLVDTKASSAGELIGRLAGASQWPLPSRAQEALFTAILTDTGQFCYSNTTPACLRMAADLREMGVDGEAIWRSIYTSKSAPELALEARARATLECFAGGKIAAISVSCRDFKETGTAPQNAEDFPNIPRALAGVQLALYFYEIQDGAATKVSLRSTAAIDSNALARQFGGGGHVQAAGCTIRAPLDAAKAEFLASAEKVVSQN